MPMKSVIEDCSVQSTDQQVARRQALMDVMVRRQARVDEFRYL